MLGVLAAAASAPKETAPPPAAAFEFLLFLARAEETVRSVSLACGEDIGVEEKAEEEIWRGKIQAYELELSRHLERWDGLSTQTMERYRSRIEELRPALDLAFEERRRAIMASAKASATQALPDASSSPANVPTVEGAAAIADPGDRELFAGDAASSSNVYEEASSVTAHTSNTNDVQDQPQAEPAKTEPVAALPWRKSTAKRSVDLGAGALKSQIEDEMVDLAEGMKGAANSFLQTLQKDNSRLEEISSAQQTNLDNVTAQTQKGKDMMKADQLGFFCTMIMVMISVMIFFLMIPFIIIT